MNDPSRPLVIFGAGPIAKLAHFYFQSDSAYRVHAFCVDEEYLDRPDFLGLPVIGAEALPSRFPPGSCEVFVAISYRKMNRAREAKYRQFKEAGYRLASYVSSRATYLATDPPGDNCFLLENNTIQPFARIGSNVTLWSGNHIGHDSTIEDHCFISSHVVVSGNCRIGERSFLGVNCTIHDSVTVGADTLVGAGAIVSRDSEPGGVFLPAKSTISSKSSWDVDI